MALKEFRSCSSAQVLHLARIELSNAYGVSQESLIYAFEWEFASQKVISFRVDQPGNAHHGSTLSYILPQPDMLQRSCFYV